MMKWTGVLSVCRWLKDSSILRLPHSWNSPGYSSLKYGANWKMPGFMWQTFHSTNDIVSNMKLSKRRNSSAVSIKILRCPWGHSLWRFRLTRPLSDVWLMMIFVKGHARWGKGSSYPRNQSECLSRYKHFLNKLKLQEQPGMLFFLSDEKNAAQVQKVKRENIVGGVKSPKRLRPPCTENLQPQWWFIGVVNRDFYLMNPYFLPQGTRVNVFDYTEVINLWSTSAACEKAVHFLSRVCTIPYKPYNTIVHGQKLSWPCYTLIVARELPRY